MLSVRLMQKTIEIHDFCKNGAKQIVNSYDLS